MKIPAVLERITEGNFRISLRPDGPQPGRLELLEKIEFVLENPRKPDNQNSASLLIQLIDRVDE